MEEKLVHAGVPLPIQYFENHRYPRSTRPNARTPSELIESESHALFAQQELSNLFSQNSTPRWVRTVIINELKTLFLRTRHLDQSSKNHIIKDFLTLLFPTFAKDHPDSLNSMARGFRKNWSCWRNVLWDKIYERYEKCQKRKEKNDSTHDVKSTSFYLKNQHISEIFSLWFKYTYEPLSQENENALKNLVLFSFHCIENYVDAHDRFFTYNGNLYTVNNIFNSSSRFDISASMDLSKYEIEDYEEYDRDELINISSEDEVQPKKRTKATKATKATSKKQLKK